MAIVKITDSLLHMMCIAARDKFANSIPTPELPEKFYTLFAEEYKRLPSVLAATRVAALMRENGLTDEIPDYCVPVAQVQPYQIGLTYLSLAGTKVDLGEGVYVSYKNSGYSVTQGSIPNGTPGGAEAKELFNEYRKALNERDTAIAEKVDAFAQCVKVFPTLNRCLQVYPAFRALVSKPILERLDTVVVRKPREKKKTTEDIRREVLNDMGVSPSKNAVVELTSALVADKFKEGAGTND